MTFILPAFICTIWFGGFWGCCSLFFFTGPERLLADAEKKLGTPKMLRVYPSDFWIGDPRESNQAPQKVRRTNTAVH